MSRNTSQDSLRTVANTIRGLAMDGVERAASGHPGMPMGTADYASVLFLDHLNFNPANTEWVNRDRFVLSAGHGSMLLYSLLYLSGSGLTLDDLKKFRQWGSLTPGHPEYGHTPGVETTTGPLGQGCGNSVGMALAEEMLAAKFNREGMRLFDHYTYVIAGDGDLMEGVSHEAFALAGHWKLNKLILFYDSNRITIEGSTDLAYSDDVRKRFEAYHWNVLEIDGHDYEAIDQALTSAKTEQDRPTIIIGHTHIGQGAPNAVDTAGSHGAPLGADEIRAAKEALGLPADQDFYVPQEALDAFAETKQAGAEAEGAWDAMRQAYAEAYPELDVVLDQHLNLTIPDNLEELLPNLEDQKSMATRKSLNAVLTELFKHIPHIVGGSADLAGSNGTFVKGYPSLSAEELAGRNMHFGIREHGMSAIMNGMALHGGWIPYGGTFLVFADYSRPAIRMAALMGLRVIFVFSHDSILLGEDGPTHQPIEHLTSLRIIPNLTVIRPADQTETVPAWIAAVRNATGPTALIVTRQTLPLIDRNECAPAMEALKGGYVLWQAEEGTPEIVLIASGSEVSICLDAAKTLAEEGKNPSVVSMPSTELFEAQSAEYQRTVIPDDCQKRITVEAGVSGGLEKYRGIDGVSLGIDRFGASAPYKILAEKFGLTADHIIAEARDLL